MTIFSHQHHHWAYVWVPCFGAFVWCGMLMAMITVYYAKGGHAYPWQDSHVPYISDIGASFLQPLFIAGSSVTAASFVAVLVIQRVLRHTGKLQANLHRREKLFSNLAILGSVIGGLGLILLSCFNDHSFRTEHDFFLGIFVVGVALSAIFITIEYRWFSLNCPDNKELRAAYIVKGIVAGILIVLAIAYTVCFETATNVAAVLEWGIAFGFTFYILSFAYDLRLSKGVPKSALPGVEQGEYPPEMCQSHYGA